MDCSWLVGVVISKEGNMGGVDEQDGGCNFFASTATDGKVMFWDVRIERAAKKVGPNTSTVLDTDLHVYILHSVCVQGVNVYLYYMYVFTYVLMCDPTRVVHRLVLDAYFLTT